MQDEFAIQIYKSGVISTHLFKNVYKININYTPHISFLNRNVENLLLFPI